MTAFGPQRHVHKYQLIKRGKTSKVYACVLPDCTHHMPHEHMVVGKKSLCHECNEEFILQKDEILEKHRVRPRCIDCRARHKRGGPKRRKMESIKEETLDKSIAELRQKMGI